MKSILKVPCTTANKSFYETWARELNGTLSEDSRSVQVEIDNHVYDIFYESHCTPGFSPIIDIETPNSEPSAPSFNAQIILRGDLPEYIRPSPKLDPETNVFVDWDADFFNKNEFPDAKRIVVYSNNFENVYAEMAKTFLVVAKSMIDYKKITEILLRTNDDFRWSYEIIESHLKKHPQAVSIDYEPLRNQFGSAIHDEAIRMIKNKL